MLIPYVFNIIAVVFLNMAAIYLAFCVYRSDKSNMVNKGFSVLIVPNLLWIDFYNLAFLVNSSNLALLFTRLTFASVFIFFIGFYYFFVIWFLKEKGWYIALGRLIVIYEVFFSLLCIFTNLIIKDFIVGEWGIRPVFSFLGSIIFHLPIIALVLIVLSKLISEHFKSVLEERQKIKYFLMGVFIFTIGNLIIGVILPFFFNIYDYYFTTNYISILFLVFTAYAILRRELFNVKIILSEVLVFTIWAFITVRTVFSSNGSDLAINFVLLILVILNGLLLLSGISKEGKLIKENLKLEKELRKRLVQKTSEMIRKMEDIVKE